MPITRSRFVSCPSHRFYAILHIQIWGGPRFKLFDGLGFSNRMTAYNLSVKPEGLSHVESTDYKRFSVC
jgi:hypothetical protein